MNDVITLLSWLNITKDLSAVRKVALSSKIGAQKALQVIENREKCKQCDKECKGKADAKRLIEAADAVISALDNFHTVGTEIIAGGVVNGSENTTGNKGKGTGCGKDTETN